MKGVRSGPQALIALLSAPVTRPVWRRVGCTISGKGIRMRGVSWI
ncbi:hypothetical protein FB559_5173 [Actinoallomurus bryophytorum]|uniref:Uncharacterized protein n=1 Tax=Actinoallomurus bryophytorum TaxID=1490222 RepID=A0A543CRD6_9ACTN|nr:hypothetical protein FB559_5173 [Actinoallomurus bryophytorum]